MEGGDGGGGRILGGGLRADCQLVILLLRIYHQRYYPTSLSLNLDGLGKEEVFGQITAKSLKTSFLVQKLFSHESRHSRCTVDPKQVARDDDVFKQHLVSHHENYVD